MNNTEDGGLVYPRRDQCADRIAERLVDPIMRKAVSDGRTLAETARLLALCAYCMADALIAMGKEDPE